MLIHGDCRERMQTLLDGSVDSIVTDPPYGLSFMGKGWDHGVPGVEFWTEALRVAKPGAHLLAFGGTRTYHRLACAIEDAGWEIRDCVMWVYGSGFPKSLNVSTAINKLAKPNAKPNAKPSAEEVEFCEWLRANSTREHVCSALGRRFWDCEVQVVNTATKERPILGRRALVPTAARWRLFKAGHGGEIPARIEQLAKPEPSRAETPGEEWTPGKGNGSVGCGQWSGWGTALKPSYEPIIVARKPLIGTVAENVLTHGTGGINVDGCRVGTSKDVPWGGPSGKRSKYEGGWADQSGDYSGMLNGSGRAADVGRWPANVIHDGSDEVVGLFPESKSSGGISPNSPPGCNGILGRYGNVIRANAGGLGDSGSAARFFYCAKASKADRDEGCEGLKPQPKQNRNSYGDQSQYDCPDGAHRVGDKGTGQARNHHPTVKPTALMRYLCRLVTPPGGIVLDPFTGSGSTGKAAILEGFRFIGIEREAEYLEIAAARIQHAQEQMMEAKDTPHQLQLEAANA